MILTESEFEHFRNCFKTWEKRETYAWPESNINDIIESLPENQPDTVGGGGYRLIKQYYTNCWLLEHCKINVGKTIIKPEW